MRNVNWRIKSKEALLNEGNDILVRNCGYNFTVEKKISSKPDSVKRLALELYLEGLGFRSIGRF